MRSAFARRASLGAAIALVGVLLLLPNLPGLGSASTAAPVAAPSSAIAYGPTAGAPAAHAPAAPSSVRSSGLAVTVSRSSAPVPDAINACSGTPNWVSGATKFFNDVSVCYSLWGGVAGPTEKTDALDLPLVPHNGVIPEYANGFWVNISTNVRIIQASVCIWATGWPLPNIGAQPITGFADSGWESQDCQAMIVGGHPNQPNLNPDTAAYWVDCYKYFWPGTNISWMINVTSGLGTVSSYKQVNETEAYSDGYTTLPTWTASVQGPFASTNFSNDVRIVTVPSTLSLPDYAPNPTQNVGIDLAAYNISGGPPTPIPAAVCQYRIQLPPSAGGTNLSYSATFGPSNDTDMSLTSPIPAQVPGATVWFNVTLFLYWDGLSEIDTVASPGYFHFRFTDNGQFPQPNEPLEKNALLTSSPNVITPGVVTFLPTGTPVNITIHEPRENVTFSSAEVDFTLHDHGGTILSSVNMHAESQNTSYVILPGLPPGASLSFRVIARDVNKTGDPSGVYTYTESGASVPAPPTGNGFFYVEVYDVSTNTLASGLNFTIANLTWSQNARISNFGFGALYSSSSGLPLYLASGTYTLTIHDPNATVERPVVVSNTTPFSVIFYISTTAVAVQSFAPPSALFAVAGVGGLAAAAVTSYSLWSWFRERRAKMEAEQRRVTL
jgi:hypothetical protein